MCAWRWLWFARDQTNDRLSFNQSMEFGPEAQYGMHRREAARVLEADRLERLCSSRETTSLMAFDGLERIAIAARNPSADGLQNGFVLWHAALTLRGGR